MKRSHSSVDESTQSFEIPFKISRGRVSNVKYINDPVHRSIKMEDVCLKIIDTPEFQRLHSLKQLGVCDWVFRGATHTRFIHSLGVAHLAEELVRSLHNSQPELEISNVDILCVKIAGIVVPLISYPLESSRW